MSLRTCGLFSNIAPLYTWSLWRELNSSDQVQYFFYTDAKGYAGIEVIKPEESKVFKKESGFSWHFLHNIYLKDVLIYQRGIVSYCLKTNYDSYIFNGEAQCISTWLAVFVCKLKRKPVIYWGHGLYGDERYLKGFVRKIFNKLADSHLIYGQRSGELMIKSGFNKDAVYIVYNSLNFELHKSLYSEQSEEELSDLKKGLFPKSSNYPLVIFIGRLTAEKKLSYLLRALAKLKNDNQPVNCLIVGDGKEKAKLQSETRELNLTENTCFFGACYDEMLNSRMIMMADCCVSPGNVGLTAIHCLSMGTPVITHDNFANQGPEAESIIENKTGLLFKENDIEDLAGKIKLLLFSIRKKTMEPFCIEMIGFHWNPKYQASIFNKAVINTVSKRVF